MKKITRNRITVLLTDAAWLAVIWGMSLQPRAVSSAQSLGLSQWLQQLLGLPYLPARLEGVLRKLAHFGEFFILGALAVVTLAVFMQAGRSPRQCVAAAGGWLVLAGLMAGLMDETLQLFTDGRSSQVWDVWLDWLGYLCGAAVAVGIWSLYRAKGKTAEKPVE